MAHIGTDGSCAMPMRTMESFHEERANEYRMRIQVLEHELVEAQLKVAKHEGHKQEKLTDRLTRKLNVIMDKNEIYDENGARKDKI